MTPLLQNERMGRRRRHDTPGAVHHVMNRGVDHGPIFFDDVEAGVKFFTDKLPELWQASV